MVIVDEADGIMNFTNYGVPISGSGPSNPRSMKNSFTLKVIHQYSLPLFLQLMYHLRYKLQEH